MAIQARVAPLMGAVDSRFVRETVKRLGGHAVDYERLDLDYAAMVQESGAELLLHAWAAGVVSEGNRVGGALLVSKQGVIRVEAAVTVDATGDGDIAWMAGAEFEQGRPGDGLVQPMSIMFSVGGVDPARAIYCGSEEQARQIQLPEGTWEELVTKAQKSGQLPAEVGVVRIYKSRRPGEVGINATQINRVDGTKVADLTRAELECRRQAYGIVDFLKKHATGYENAYLAAMPAVVGVRETRRFLGVEYLCREDVVSGRSGATPWFGRPASRSISTTRPVVARQKATRARDLPPGCSPTTFPMAASCPARWTASCWPGGASAGATTPMPRIASSALPWPRGRQPEPPPRWPSSTGFSPGRSTSPRSKSPGVNFPRG